MHIPIYIHATCYKFLSSMLHATRMNLFIIVACTMLQIFHVVFAWPHHATTSKGNSLMTQENVRIKVRIFVKMNVSALIKSFCSSWRTGMLQALSVSLVILHLPIYLSFVHEIISKSVTNYLCICLCVS